jgi:ribosomal protein S18 acetylase RimI-like enzyme
MEVHEAAREELRAAHEARLATWRVAYRGIVPDDYLDALTLTPERLAAIEERFDEGRAVTYVATDAGQVVGMAVRGPSRDEDRLGEEELWALYVLPACWGGSAAQALWDETMPFTSLWVLEDNARAQAFYARNGFAPDGHRMAVEFVADVYEVRYVRTDA